MGQAELKEKIKTYAVQLGISDVGIAPVYPYTELLAVLDKSNTPFVPAPKKRIDPSALLAGAQSAVMGVFHYYGGEEAGNIARFARGVDYHQVVGERLGKLADYIKSLSLGAETFLFCDTSPLCERYMAYLAGLGLFGRNQLLIHPVFGSYVVIGGLLTTLPIAPDSPISGGCRECHRCVEACPGGALEPDGSFDASACVSYITQKKGELDESQKGAIKNSGKIYGCDVCADVCPMNQKPFKSSIEGFSQGLIGELSMEQLAWGKDFQKAYANRAFGWRGADVLMRNLACLKAKS